MSKSLKGEDGFLKRLIEVHRSSSTHAGATGPCVPIAQVSLSFARHCAATPNFASQSRFCSDPALTISTYLATLYTDETTD